MSAFLVSILWILIFSEKVFAQFFGY
jgi:hypothetical protein